MNFDSAIFYSNDLEKVISFYQDELGLELDESQDGKYVSFRFANGVKLGIKKAVEEREVPGAQSIIIAVENIDELYKKAEKSGWEIYKTLREEPWGKNFSVLDPDGNKVQFVGG